MPVAASPAGSVRPGRCRLVSPSRREIARGGTPLADTPPSVTIARTRSVAADRILKVKTSRGQQRSPRLRGRAFRQSPDSQPTLALCDRRTVQTAFALRAACLRRYRTPSAGSVRTCRITGLSPGSTSRRITGAAFSAACRLHCGLTRVALACSASRSHCESRRVSTAGRCCDRRFRRGVRLRCVFARG